MEVALITLWQTFASSFGKLCVLPLEWFYVRFIEEEAESWVAARVGSILNCIPGLSEANACISLAYDIITLRGLILPLDPLYCAECLRVIGG